MEATGPLLLRPRTLPDLPELWNWLHGTPDPEWRRWDAPYLHAPGNEAGVSLSDFTARALTDLSPDSLRVIEIGGQASGLVTRSWEAPPEGGWLELGIVIFDPACWGQGLGTLALRQWTGLCLHETPAHVLSLTTWSGNERMMGSALRVGYRECGRVRQARLWEGARYDSVRLDLLRREWEGSADSREGQVGLGRVLYLNLI